VSVFSAEDFDLPHGYEEHWTRKHAAACANARIAKLEEALEDLADAWRYPENDYAARKATADVVAEFVALKRRGR
jgi:hypothetical protein